MAETNQPPFTMAFVVGKTAKYMLRDVEISIEKTTARIGEFADDQEKSSEIFLTLSALHNMRKCILDWQKSNRNQENK